jgi:type II secretory pathway pseudopilin PulG
MKLQLQAVKKIKDDGGFTLIELIITVALIFLVVSAVSATFIIAINTSGDVIDVITSVKDSRLIIYRISRDIREAVEISEAESDSVTFRSFMYIGNDYEVINYYLVSDDGYYTLYRKEGDGAPRAVASKIINNNVFTYYTGVDEPENGMGSVSTEELDSIKIIKIDLSVDQSGSATDRTMDLKTQIALRNRV